MKGKTEPFGVEKLPLLVCLDSSSCDCDSLMTLLNCSFISLI